MGIKLQISFPYLPQSDIVKTKGYVNERSILQTQDSVI